MHSALWSISQQLIRQGLVAVFMLVLARRISPLELGIIGVANVWNSFLALFLELGFGAALVQRKEVTPQHIASAFFINLVCGLVLMVLSMAASGPVSAAMKAPAAQPVIFTLSITFLITSIATVQNSIAQKELRFKTLALRDFAANSIAAAVGIILAFQGFGVWAVVANSLLVNLLGCIFIWRVTPHRIHFRDANLAAARELWAFGSTIFGYSVLKHSVRNLDSIFLGSLFGPEKLGLYNLAQRIAMAPTKGIQTGISAFLFPKASQLQDDLARLREMYLLAYKSLHVIIVLFIILMQTIGVELLPLFFGRQWESALPLVRIILLLLLVSPALAPLGELIKATNRPRWLINWTFLLMGLNAAGLMIGFWFGFTASVAGYVASNFLALPAAIWMVRRITGLRAVEFWSRLKRSYFVAVAIGACAYLAWQMWSGHPLVLRLVSFLLAGCYLAATYCLEPDLRRLFNQMLRKKVKRVAAPVLAETKISENGF